MTHPYNMDASPSEAGPVARQAADPPPAVHQGTGGRGQGTGKTRAQKKHQRQNSRSAPPLPRRGDPHPTIAQEIAIDRYRRSHHRHDVAWLACKLFLPERVVAAVLRWQQWVDATNQFNAYFAEREVPADKTVFCPRCHERLTVYVQGQPCRRCRMNDYVQAKKRAESRKRELLAAAGW